jgi:hypothetical protein
VLNLYNLHHHYIATRSPVWFDNGELSLDGCTRRCRDSLCDGSSCRCRHRGVCGCATRISAKTMSGVTSGTAFSMVRLLPKMAYLEFLILFPSFKRPAREPSAIRSPNAGRPSQTLLLQSLWRCMPRSPNRGERSHTCLSTGAGTAQKRVLGNPPTMHCQSLSRCSDGGGNEPSIHQSSLRR